MLMRANYSSQIDILDQQGQAVTARGLQLAYGDQLILPGVDLDVPNGSAFALVGPNGAGKSSLIKVLLGLIKPQAGQIDLACKRLAYVPQRSAVDWHFPATALDIVKMGRFKDRKWYQLMGRHDTDRAMAALSAVGLSAQANLRLSALSGGQAQRVFLARALCQDADLIVLDEPMAGIDAPSQEVIIEQLKRLRVQGKTVLAVHHDLKQLDQIFTHAALLNRGLVAAGSLAEVMTRGHLTTAYGLPMDLAA